MKTTRLTITMTMISLLVYLVAATTTETTAVEEDHQAARDKKMDKMMKDMYLAFMLAKNMIGFVLMFVSPIIQIKGFGLSVINTLVNIARFVLQMQTAKQMKLLHSSHQPHITSYSSVDTDRWSGSGPGQYAYYSPPPQSNWNYGSKALTHPDMEVDLPPAQASYISGGFNERVYPYYNPNTTRYRR